MKTIRNNIISVVLSLLISSLIGITPVAQAGELDFNDEQNAKVSRFKAKGRVVKNRSDGDLFPEEVEGDDLPGLSEDDKCGTVDIGNVTEDRSFGAPRQVDIIITGDVINAGNNCK